jgi:hypothetical protein
MNDLMLVAMLLAHFVGDYWLQWDALALWKSRSITGAVVHGVLVFIVTILIALLVDPSWWLWAAFIGISHVVIDGGQQWWKEWQQGNGALLSPLTRFLLDQVLHLGIIWVVVIVSGKMPAFSKPNNILTHRWLLTLLGYVLVTLPAWIIIEFTVRGLIQGDPPNFQESTNKYIGSLERGLMTTCVILGQFILVPLVTLPRFVLEHHQMRDNSRQTIYVAELLASIGFAVGVGLFLRQLW